MSTTAVPDRFTTLPDENNLQATVVALEEHGFSVEVVGDLDAARRAALARIPEGSSVMTNASMTLTETGIADAINDGDGRWESARNNMFALDFATQAQEMKAIGGLGTPTLFIDGVLHRRGYGPPTLLAALAP
jgi:LUD domain